MEGNSQKNFSITKKRETNKHVSIFLLLPIMNYNTIYFPVLCGLLKRLEPLNAPHRLLSFHIHLHTLHKSHSDILTEHSTCTALVLLRLEGELQGVCCWTSQRERSYSKKTPFTHRCQTNSPLQNSRTSQATAGHVVGTFCTRQKHSSKEKNGGDSEVHIALEGLSFKVTVRIHQAR